MPATTPDLSIPRAALTASIATRARVRPLPVADAERVRALTAAMGSLRDSWTDAHETYCRRGPIRDKPAYTPADPVRAFARERRVEMGRLRSMLNPRTGTPRPRAERHSNAEKMWGHISAFTRALTSVSAKHEQSRDRNRHGSITAVKGGGYFMSMRELHADARKLLDQLIEARRELRTAWSRFLPDSDTDPYGDGWEKLAERVDVLRAEADRLAADLRRSLRKRKPDPYVEPDTTWTKGRILRTLDAYQREHGGRLPTQHQCNTSPALPAWPLIIRRVGNPPMTMVRQSLRLPDARAQAS